MTLAGTRRSTWRAKRGRAGIWRARFKRFGVAALVLIVMVWAGAWLYLSGGFVRAADWSQERVFAITADMGFRVEDILVEGRTNADSSLILAVVDKEKGAPIFSFDPAAAKEKIEKISWVKSARVERRLPSTIFIRLEERRPLALWQHGEKMSLVDSEGKILTESRLTRFKDLVMITGADAPAHAPGLLALLAAEPVIGERTESAAWIGGRRWDLKLKDGIMVRLPEEDVGLALRRLGKAQEEEGLLDKDIANIDLRDPGRIIVRTHPGAVQEYKTGLKTGDDI